MFQNGIGPGRARAVENVLNAHFQASVGARYLSGEKVGDVTSHAEQGGDSVHQLQVKCSDFRVMKLLHFCILGSREIKK